MAAIDYKNIKFDWKALATVAIMVTMWYDLKTDFTVHKEGHKFIEYRIEQLEGKIIALNQNNAATLPEAPKQTINKKRNE